MFQSACSRRGVSEREGERFILVTDGITEAENQKGEFFGDNRLESAAHLEKPLEEIFASVQRFREEVPLRDDCTVLELRYL
jgi:sigma-B regulation protein RsbU (phosphoserine phosphatase)